MANQVDIGNNSILIIKIPARGATDWAAEFKTNFADLIAEHDHTTGKGARIKNAALVTNAMVAAGEGVTDTNNDFTAYTSADVAVSTDTIQDLAVTTAKIANDAVDGTKIADNSITADHIVDGTIIAADVANDAITTAKILDANVTTAKIADSNVTTAKIADSNVTASKIGSDVVLSTLNNVASTSPTSGQVLKWSGTEWAPATDQAGSGGGSITSITNQTDANSYSPSEGDTLKITADVTFDNVTFNKIKMYVAETNTLTFNRGTIDNCEILGGSVHFKAQSTQTMTLKNSKISACDSVIIEQDKVESEEVVTITVKNVDIVCKEYAYFTSYQNYSEREEVDRTTTSEFTNVSVNFSSVASLSGYGTTTSATADFSHCRFIGVTTTGSSLALSYIRTTMSDLGEELISGNSSYETGTIASNNLLIGTDSGGLKVVAGQTSITSFT